MQQPPNIPVPLKGKTEKDITGTFCLCLAVVSPSVNHSQLLVTQEAILGSGHGYILRVLHHKKEKGLPGLALWHLLTQVMLHLQSVTQQKVLRKL